MKRSDILIIGAGPVGLFAIFQAGMLGMKASVIDALPFVGGQCAALYPEKPIYDIPAYPKILGKDLVSNLLEQAEPFKPSFYLGQKASEFSFASDEYLQIVTNQGEKLQAKAIIIAAGAGCFDHNKPPISNIGDFEDSSVFYHVEQAERFRDKNIVIAGGGDSAVDWAIYLSDIAKHIFLVHRRDKFRAAPQNIQKIYDLAEKKKITLLTGYQLFALEGKAPNLEIVKIQNFQQEIIEIKADILLPFFGLAQSLGDIANFGLNLKHNHVAVSLPYYQTNIEAIYAIGDVASYDGKFKLILTGFAEAASALHHAYNKVFNGKALHFEYSTTKGPAIFNEKL